MRLIKETKIDFMAQSRLGTIISTVLIIAGLLSIIFQGGLRLSIDFRGGSMVAVKYTSEMDIYDIREVLSSVSIEGQTYDFSKNEIKHFGDLSTVSLRVPTLENQVENLNQWIVDFLYEAFPNDVPVDKSDFILSVETVGPKIGAELSGKAYLAIISALIMILIYISVRFEFKFALGAIAALAHDVFITLGIFSIMDYEISLSVVAAFLTIVGYSLNDTIVIFDRIRENIKGMRSSEFSSIINQSINSSLSRTIITSMTTFGVVFVLWLWGGEVIHNFAFAMIIGVIIGTYSSIYVASPIVLRLHAKDKFKK
ncbi:MAG: protein translocase subunit SecF [Candidatus Marinimicrobia bacterium]|nr:protein translocase subunit SecF [Candidatus Neomarinimicrobiota bacterium]